MLDAHNILVKTFRYAKQRLMDDNMQELKIKLFAQRRTDGREYDLPTGDELAALIVNDSGQATYEQDIIVEHQNSRLERISVYHPSLMACNIRCCSLMEKMDGEVILKYVVVQLMMMVMGRCLPNAISMHIGYKLAWVKGIHCYCQGKYSNNML
ncbi:hypothetical protein LINPERHAP1_LOCUS22657 [Linum perenne]